MPEFSCLNTSDPIAVAVSGGSDSMALLRLAARGARENGSRIIAATVDHGLRPEAAREASWVKDQCARISADLNLTDPIQHETLHWTGPKPSTGIPAAARQARYALLADWARRHGADRILIGHTMDDQAETVAFRIASGAGARGLTGLRTLGVCPVWPEGRGILLARPLLDVRRADLKSLLKAEGVEWLSDPTNEDDQYARPRMRARLAAMSDHAPGLIPRLAALGAKLSAAQAGTERAALDLLERHLRFDAFGAGLLALAPLQVADRETRIAALSLTILAASGESHATAWADVAQVWDKLSAKACAVSLGGARIGRLGKAHDHALLITRDPGAASGRAGGPAPADLTLPPGQTVVFDGRFEIKTSSALPAPIRIKALGRDARRGLYPSETMKAALGGVPAHARPGLPQILFAKDGAAASLPRFIVKQCDQLPEKPELPWVLARFLGEDRIAAVRKALTGGQSASL
ncbi:MAG: tRNA lysidine(34) synthetase TilS [Caulobacterales bacterium]